MTEQNTNDYTPRITPPPVDEVSRVAALWGGDMAPALVHSGKPGDVHGRALFSVSEGNVRDIVYSLHGVHPWIHAQAIPGLLYQFLSPTGGVLPWSAVDAPKVLPVEAATVPLATPEEPPPPPGVALYDVVATVHARIHRAFLATSVEDARACFDPVEATWGIDSLSAEADIESVTRMSPAEMEQTFMADLNEDDPDVAVTQDAADVLAATGREDLYGADLSLADVRDLVGAGA